MPHDSNPSGYKLRRISWLTDLLDLDADDNTYKAIRNGYVPPECVVKVGRTIRIKPDAVCEWLGIDPLNLGEGKASHE